MQDGETMRDGQYDTDAHQPPIGVIDAMMLAGTARLAVLAQVETGTSPYSGCGTLPEHCERISGASSSARLMRLISCSWRFLRRDTC